MNPCGGIEEGALPGGKPCGWKPGNNERGGPPGGGRRGLNDAIVVVVALEMCDQWRPSLLSGNADKCIVWCEHLNISDYM